MITTREALRDSYYDIESAISSIKAAPTQSNIMELQNELNRFFNESTCKGIIYTNNPDKLFFGIYVMPSVKADDIVTAIVTDSKFIVQEYYVELDSKLFGEYLDLNDREITCALLHDIFCVIGNSAPIEIVKQEIDRYLAEQHDVIKISDSVHYREILSYGFRDAMRKSTTLFEKDEYMPDSTLDDFIDWVPYTDIITRTLDKVSRMGYNYNKEVDNKFIVLSWVLRVYKDVLHNRIPAMMTLERCKELTPSQIEKKELDNMYRRLSRIDDDSLLESDSETLLRNIRSNLSNYRNGVYYTLMESVEDDVLNILNYKDAHADDDPECIPDLLHKLNSKMALVKDYVESDKNMTKDEWKQWNKMYREMQINRNHIAHAKFYQNRKCMYNKWDAQEEV